MTTIYIDDEDALNSSSSEDFETEYERIFSDDGTVDRDIGEFERDAVTGRKAKQPKMSVLNKSKVSKQELDELFLS